MGKIAYHHGPDCRVNEETFFGIPAVSIMFSGIKYNIPGGQSMHISTLGSKVNKV